MLFPKSLGEPEGSIAPGRGVRMWNWVWLRECRSFVGWADRGKGLSSEQAVACARQPRTRVERTSASERPPRGLDFVPERSGSLPQAGGNTALPTDGS